MELFALPAFQDNYIWIVHDGHAALVVDPGDGLCVERELKHRGLSLTHILVTHSHPDHVGGLPHLCKAYPQAIVYGPRDEPAGGVSHAVAAPDALQALGLDFQVLDVPGHTRGHIAYFAPMGLGAHDSDPVLFIGDTLFSGGCGRVFDGSIEQLYFSLLKLEQLPAATRICCAHEYTLANLQFARAVEPGNRDLEAYEVHCRGLRAQGLPTLPSSMRVEKAINPFLRITQSEVIASAMREGALDAQPQTVFAALRQWKNRF